MLGGQKAELHEKGQHKQNNLKPGTSVLILIVGSKWFGNIFSLTSGIAAALRGFAVLACPLLAAVERLTENLGLATILQSGLRPCLYDIFLWNQSVN